MPVALVTGASRGLGRALAHGLADLGWSLVVDARGADDLRSAVRDLPAGQVVALPGDVTDPPHRRDLVAAAAALGGLDLLVNNASALGPSPLPSVAEVPPAALRALWETNVVAPVALVQEALPLLVPPAAVVSVTSDAAVGAWPGWGPYGATKAALDHLTAVLAAERPDLRCWSLDPGDLRTRMHQDAFPGEDISDRPVPESVVPAFVRLLDERPPSGRLRAADLLPAVAR
ncbi:SDR family NAD(P)-dependent oxidoreductase [Vallicoccus soli]|uniref:SDR family NAD(P)-dependent oxidoreductase n=1 Tax=Vallicoccus soli TaxID=2339232 RepID=UPI001C499C4E|nr:SDR family oxidoreductase [Vallicoccus soli]